MERQGTGPRRETGRNAGVGVHRDRDAASRTFPGRPQDHLSDPVTMPARPQAGAVTDDWTLDGVPVGVGACGIDLHGWLGLGLRWAISEVDGDDLDNEAMLTPGRLQAVAFAIWNGESQERNGQKAVASWMQLQIDPVKPVSGGSE